MTNQISYFDVAAFLVEIEPDYANYLDPIERAKLIGDIATGQVEDRIEDGKDARCCRICAAWR